MKGYIQRHTIPSSWTERRRYNSNQLAHLQLLVINRTCGRAGPLYKLDIITFDDSVRL